jgi:peptide methionine sulfoxide reductase MsrA
MVEVMTNEIATFGAGCFWGVEAEKHGGIGCHM